MSLLGLWIVDLLLGVLNCWEVEIQSYKRVCHYWVENSQTPGYWFKPKVKTRIACWKVRTLYQTGKLAQVVREFHNYSLDILGVCEARWTGLGQRTLASGHTILYLGRLDGHHTEGVALIMSRKMERTLIEWKPSGLRLLQARFNSKYTKLTVILCWRCWGGRQRRFYDQLQAVTDEVPTYDLLIVLGDLNARPRNNNTVRDHVMGKHGIGTINDNGERLFHFCDENNMVIGGTLFRHRNIKTTWTLPSGATKSHIDHILINGKWKSSLQDERVYRGADVPNDHNLLVAVVSLKLCQAQEVSKGATSSIPVNWEMIRSDKLLDRSWRTASKCWGKNRRWTLTPLTRHLRKQERRSLDLKRRGRNGYKGRPGRK